jgi:hypothetical protein
MWTTFAYYSTNYAMLILPPRTSGSKVLYTHHYKAEIGGEDSRGCIRYIPDPRLLNQFGCN